MAPLYGALAISAGQPSDRPRKKTPPQFGIGSLLWLTATIGIALAYLRSLDDGAAKIVAGLQVVGVALLVGSVVGATAGRLFAAVYWSLLAAVFAYLFALDVAEFHWSMRYIWALVGASAGAHASAVPSRGPLVRMAAGALAGGAVMTVSAIVFYYYTRQFMVFDLICATIAGALLGAVIEATNWLEQQFSLSRNVCAAGLMLCVIAANLFLPGLLGK